MKVIAEFFACEESRNLKSKEMIFVLLTLMDSFIEDYFEIFHQCLSMVYEKNLSNLSGHDIFLFSISSKNL
jgi:hypothetical protein